MGPIYLCVMFLYVAVFANLINRHNIVLHISLLVGMGFVGLLLINNNYGVDIVTYKAFWQNLSPGEFWLLGTDVGYAALMSLFKINGLGFYSFLFTINIFSLLLISKAFRRYSPYIALSWFIYFALYLGYNHTILRQGIAIALTTYSLRYILNKDRTRYLICVILSCLFHSSAVLFMPIYWLVDVFNRRKWIYILVSVSFPLIFLDTSILIAKIGGLFGLPEGLVYAYFNSQSDTFERAGMSIGVIVKLVGFIMFGLGTSNNNRLHQILFNIYGVYLILYFPLASVSMLSARGLDYYKIIETIMLPIAIYNTKYISNKIIFTLFVIVYMTYAWITSYEALFERAGRFDSLLLSIMSSF